VIKLHESASHHIPTKHGDVVLWTYVAYTPSLRDAKGFFDIDLRIHTQEQLDLFLGFLGIDNT
jgi:hypothetical protein